MKKGDKISMLKKIVTTLLALCLVAAALVPACAETAQAPEKKVINWDAERQQQFTDAGYAGEFKTFGSANISVMIPNDFQQGKLTDESVATGTMAAFLKADGSMIAIAQTKPTGDVTFHNMDEFEEMARKGDPNGNFQRAVVNGLEVLISIMPEKDVCTVMTLLDNGELFTVNCAKLSANKDLYSFVAASLQIQE